MYKKRKFENDFMKNKKLRIAQLVLPWLPLPPPGYAGTERVVYNLTEGLVKKGHKVTLFSVGETKTSAKLEYIFEKAFGLQPDVMKTLKSSFYPLMHVANCFEKQDDFDIIHSHAQFLALPFASISKIPSVHTFHRTFQFPKQDDTDLVSRYGKKLNFVSISNAQRIPNINFVATVYNGIDTDKFIPTKNPSRDYIFWAGRLVDKKGPLEAIKISKKLNIKLIMAGNVTEPQYFHTIIEPEIINDPLISHIGEISQSEMIKLFQNAKLTIVPTKWNEPFGLIPVESMACGRHVISFANGGVVETIVDGETGFLIDEKDSVDGLIRKVEYVINMPIDKYKVLCQNSHNHIINNFSNTTMVDNYEKVYYKILNKE